MNDNRPEDALVIAADGFAGNSGLPRGFNWRAFDAYLFDIDGTLLNSRDPVHYEAFLIAMRELSGRAVSLDGVTLHGSTDPLILLAALERAGISRGRRPPRAAGGPRPHVRRSRDALSRTPAGALPRRAPAAERTEGGGKDPRRRQRQPGAHRLGQAQGCRHRRLFLLRLVQRPQ